MKKMVNQYVSFFIVDALKAHASSITKVQYIEDKNLLITASKDKHIKFWEPTVDWMDKKVY